MKKELHPLDVRNWTKEEALNKLYKAEMTYLFARGWITLTGVPNKFYIPPQEGGGDIREYIETAPRYTHDEAVKIQKEKDLDV